MRDITTNSAVEFLVVLLIAASIIAISAIQGRGSCSLDAFGKRDVGSYQGQLLRGSTIHRTEQIVIAIPVVRVHVER